MKNKHFGNKSLKDMDFDELENFIDDEYHYDKWRKKKQNKKRQSQQGEYGDEWIDGVDE